MADLVTKMVASYIKQKDITIKEISRYTAISNNILQRSLIELTRPLRANEFLAICAFLEINPSDLKRNILTQQIIDGELKKIE
jgi:DNA-binding Xre family transcriptional regulator